MDQLLNHLREDYQRTIRKIPVDHFKTLGLISFEDVLKAHYFLIDYFAQEEGASIYGVKDLNLLGSALGRQMTEFGGHKKWNGTIEITGTLFFGLVMNHAFHDGNKRTALLILIYSLIKNNYQFRDNCNKEKLEEMAVNIAANNLSFYGRYEKFIQSDDPEVNLIIDFLHRNTRLSDKRFYPLTYWDFNTKLKRFGVFLDNPAGNHINVYKTSEVRIPFLKTITKTKRIMQIGFPGWKRVINHKAAKEVLKNSGLIAENGIDSQVFYKGSDPISYLIDFYNVPLRRLRDR